MALIKICPNCKQQFQATKTQTYCSRHCAALFRMGNTRSRGNNRSRSGRRSDLGDKFFRSRWEANFARYLNFLMSHNQILSWEFEPKIFYFPIKRGNTSYTPDFRVQVSEDHYEWHEVKGWMDDNSRVKLKRFEKYYPEEYERLVLIDKEVYQDIAEKVSGLIEHWED